MKEFDAEIQTADGMMDMFVCHPEEGGPFPAIILYMDAPGIREELRDMARRIGTSGYFVILPNLYYRRGREGNYGFDRERIREDDSERTKMFELMNETTTVKVVRDAESLLDFIAGEQEASAGQIGCVGYCMSGKYVVQLGAEYPDNFAAIASFYGVDIQTEEPDSPHLSAHKIKGELYLAFASHDPYVSESLLERIPQSMNRAGVNYRMEIYPNTEHGFAFPLRPVYNKPAAERHWERMLALFERNLKM
ncbi:dienelactone hydrolase family protein [uncultured Sneathiella sp.]|uniref:dienelactone hydrolase family protein n=1 Tax=uncultured Sneathiella sp. TaxID=879315 RepID=UPI002595CA84|nr:dienelactone hydrolase family protein [uncultured Sneathiella sp.]